ncbi:MAG TPA: 4Fe-4S binding protein [Sedimentibacter sp.]|nr:4Fe-4S binding protein [Sedimentibacter sp.]
MKLNIRSKIQLTATLIVIISCLFYGLYIYGIIDFRIVSIGDLNPYGGWSALKCFFTDLSYRWKGFSRSIALTAGIGLASFLLGRFFCGYFCPIGAMQDFFKYVGNKLRLKEIKFPYKPELLKYLVLIIIMVLSILGMGNLISPLSPWLAYLNIFVGLRLQPGVLILLLIILVSLMGRRIFCRYFCPLGAFQSLLYAIGPMKIKKGACDCSYCLKNCPVSIDYNRVEKDIPPECINCLQCVNGCIKGKEGFSINFNNKKINKSAYISICILIIAGSYILLPLTASSSSIQAITSITDINDGTYEGYGLGFGGRINTEVTIKDNRITSIKILSHSETEGYYEEVFRDLSYEITESQNLNLDAISGATSTSRGFLNSVRDAVNKSLND